MAAAAVVGVVGRGKVGGDILPCCGRKPVCGQGLHDFRSHGRSSLRATFPPGKGRSAILHGHRRVDCRLQEKDGRGDSRRRPIVSKLQSTKTATIESSEIPEEVAIPDSAGVSILQQNDSDVSRNGEAAPGWWSRGLADVPARVRLVGAMSLAFVVCNMDKVNMSVAIIPMSHEFGWSATTAGIVQSSFFWGYALSQLPGGWVSSRLGGRSVLRGGVLLWSMATAVVPFVASSLPLLCASRVVVGLGEGVSPSAATDVIAKSIPKNERSRATTAVFSGLNVGSVVGLLFAPHCIEAYGWPSVFYGFGALGLLWYLSWSWMVDEQPQGQSPAVARAKEALSSAPPALPLEEGMDASSGSGVQRKAGDVEQSAADGEPVPWREMFSSPAVWAMICVHFCGNWGHYNLLAWMPTYFESVLGIDLTGAALLSILPPLAAVACSSLAAVTADSLVTRGVAPTTVRKLSQSIAFLGTAGCMAIVGYVPDLTPAQTVAVITIGNGLSGFVLAGLFCTHQDISPKWASVLLGITNTFGALPGVVGVALTGYLLDQTGGSWTEALFAPCIGFYLFGTLIWNLFASSERQDFKSPQKSA